MRSRNYESLITVGNVESQDQRTLMESNANQVKHYIGTIEIPGIAKGTACLLKKGKVLTCLHNILDYSVLDKGRAELIDFDTNDVSVFFVRDDNIYKYKINSSPVNGLNKLKSGGSGALCFDYALLEVEGDPVRDLGGGFKPDQTNHFGSASNVDPTRTLAISGPFATLTERGEVEFHRFTSISENQAAESGFYQFTQAGDHPSAPGFSGMGIVAIDRSYSINTLYAIHSYRDNQGQQSGAKISEIRSSVRNDISSSSNPGLDPYVIHTLRSWHETLRLAIINPDRSVSAGREITFEEAVGIVLSGQGNYLSDIKSRTKSRKEARDPIVEAVRREGSNINAIQDHSPHNPQHKKELSHLHPPSHSTHAFYDTTYWQKKAAEEQETKSRQDENKKRQRDATKARNEAKAESNVGQIKQERKERKNKKSDGHSRH